MIVSILNWMRCSRCILGHQVPLVDDRTGEAVCQVVVADGRDGDVELHGIDAVAEDACLHPALKDARDHVHELPAGDLDDLRFFQVLGSMQVFAVNERQKFRFLQVVFPGEAHRFFERCPRVKIFQVQLLLGVANIEIGLFENGLEQDLLALEIVVDHALVVITHALVRGKNP